MLTPEHVFTLIARAKDLIDFFKMAQGWVKLKKTAANEYDAKLAELKHITAQLKDLDQKRRVAKERITELTDEILKDRDDSKE
jgi:hypothetical protein